MEIDYLYKAFIISVYDGDTITANISLGFGVELKKQKLRLFGIDAPEIRGKEREQGLRSRDLLRNLILEKEVIIHTKKDKKGKYGRYLATVFKDGINVNEYLVDNGYAKYKKY